MSDVTPGYYWARRKLDEPGRPRKWTVVLVEDTSAWSVWEVGSDVISDQGVWEFGPRLEPGDYEAFRELVKLSSHYARLLNDYDGGCRLTFKTPEEWIGRLREISGKGPRLEPPEEK